MKFLISILLLWSIWSCNKENNQPESYSNTNYGITLRVQGQYNDAFFTDKVLLVKDHEDFRQTSLTSNNNRQINNFRVWLQSDDEFSSIFLDIITDTVFNIYNDLVDYSINLKAYITNDSFVNINQNRDWSLDTIPDNLIFNHFEYDTTNAELDIGFTIFIKNHNLTCTVEGSGTVLVYDILRYYDL